MDYCWSYRLDPGYVYMINDLLIYGNAMGDIWEY